MKTALITTFAIALMVFAFNASPVFAKGWWKNGPNGLAQVEELKDPGGTETASQDSNSTCDVSGQCWEWFNEEDTESLEKALASWEDGEEAGHYKGQWFNVDENGDVEVAYGCKTNPDGSVHCPGDAWNSEKDESQIAGQRPRYHDGNSLDLSRDRRDYNDYIKNFASLSCTTDRATGERVCCTAYSGGGMFCYYPNATESEGTQVAGMTLDEKVQQDEDDWNKFILQRMFSSLVDHCSRHGNCMMNEEGDAPTQFARPYPPPGSGYCDPYTVGTYCPSNNEGERDIEQREFASGGGQEDSFSAAGVVLGDSPAGTTENSGDGEETANGRVLKTGSY